MLTFLAVVLYADPKVWGWSSGAEKSPNRRCVDVRGDKESNWNREIGGYASQPVACFVDISLFVALL